MANNCFVREHLIEWCYMKSRIIIGNGIADSAKALAVACIVSLVLNTLLDNSFIVGCAVLQLTAGIVCEEDRSILGGSISVPRTCQPKR